MFSRVKHDETGLPLPQDWSDALVLLLNETYEKECAERTSVFDIHGIIYPKELIAIVSLVDEKDPNKLPIACFISCNAEDVANDKAVKETQKNYIDLFSLLFDEIFQNQDWNDYEILWQEIQYKNKTYFYKITRENIALSLEASKLLGEEFED
jgi:hypothetical protein